MRRPGVVVVCAGVILIGSAACATKEFVQRQVTASESRLTERVNSTESKATERAAMQQTQLSDTAQRVDGNRQAIDQVNALANQVKAQTDAVASESRARADATARAVQDGDARLAQRIAARNKYRVLDTRTVYFHAGQSLIRPDDATHLDELANVLKGDANALLEMQGFADPRGTDRHNNDLARERVEAVARYFVGRHGVELHQLRTVTMGKIALPPGDSANPEQLAKARRVDLRLIAQWSSWEDVQARDAESDDAVAASPATTPATPATTMDADRPATPAIAPRDAPEQPARWREIMKTISPGEFGTPD